MLRVFLCAIIPADASFISFHFISESLAVRQVSRDVSRKGGKSIV